MNYELLCLSMIQQRDKLLTSNDKSLGSLGRHEARALLTILIKVLWLGLEASGWLGSLS